MRVVDGPPTHFAFNPDFDDFDAYFRDDPHGISSLERFRLGSLVGWKSKKSEKNRFNPRVI